MLNRWLGLSFVVTAASCSSAPTVGTPGAQSPASEPARPVATTSQAAISAAPATSSAPAPAPVGSAAKNPFEGAKFFINPDYVKKAEAAAAKSPALAGAVKKVTGFPTAVWLDSIAKAGTVAATLEQAAKQKGADGKPVLTVFAVYNMPNRDCSAKASAGELSVEAGGEARYKTEFIDKIAAQFASHPDQRIVAIIEPDSLPNMATNLSVPKCAASANAYKQSIAYAVTKLSMPHVTLYLDAAHGGWLGWDGNRTKIAEIYKEVLTAAGGAEKIRGFATNISNFNVLTGEDGKRMEPSNPCPNELMYVQKLSESLAAVGIVDKKFIIDTARNGRAGIRAKWSSWCNVKGAGLGERPQASPAPLVDAYYWVKPPGESDGTSEPTQPRFDAGCKSPDSAPHAPQAGEWFESYFLDLVKNAQPAL